MRKHKRLQQQLRHTLVAQESFQDDGRAYLAANGAYEGLAIEEAIAVTSCVASTARPASLSRSTWVSDASKRLEDVHMHAAIFRSRWSDRRTPAFRSLA